MRRLAGKPVPVAKPKSTAPYGAMGGRRIGHDRKGDEHAEMAPDASDAQILALMQAMCDL